jgi:hypothetical protein
VRDDTAQLIGCIAGLLAVVAVALGVNAYNAHRPCSDFNNVSVRYVPLRCLPGGK